MSLSTKAALALIFGGQGPDKRYRPETLLELLGRNFPAEMAPVAQHVADRLAALGESELSPVQVQQLRMEAENLAIRALLLHKAVESGLSGETALKAVSLAARLGAAVEKSLHEPGLLPADGADNAGAVDVSQLWADALKTQTTEADETAPIEEIES